MANYIQTLQNTVDVKEEEIQELKNKMQEIVEYLSLPKFENETWVSKFDILRMLDRY
jgi:flagellar biosynthesis chaperone FliJ